MTYNVYIKSNKGHNNVIDDRLVFASEAEAAQWMYDTIDDSCNDNYRFAYEYDDKAVLAYDEAIDEGCCGKFDAEIIVNGHHAMIGCNYGH